jgi:hypothetical protein
MNQFRCCGCGRFVTGELSSFAPDSEYTREEVHFYCSKCYEIHTEYERILDELRYHK